MGVRGRGAITVSHTGDGLRIFSGSGTDTEAGCKMTSDGCCSCLFVREQCLAHVCTGGDRVFVSLAPFSHFWPNVWFVLHDSLKRFFFKVRSRVGERLARQNTDFIINQ